MIYLDSAATTGVKGEVLDAMTPYFLTLWGNPSSHHDVGEMALNGLNEAKDKIAEYIGCTKDQLIFTSGASEANNLIIKGLKKNDKKHIISSKYEHHSVLNVLKYLEGQGYEVTYLDVKDGIVDPKDVFKAIRKDTVMCTIMAINNELGTINPISEIGRICQAFGVFFHVDATQYIGHTIKHLPLDVVDAFSFSGHKFHAPKGIGALYIKDKTRLEPQIIGGQQEFGLRAGTENVPYIVGMAKALELSRYIDMDKILTINKMITDNLLSIPGTVINGDPIRRCPFILNVSFKNVRGEVLAELLNTYEIYVSTGSACNSESDEPSHVLTAIGLSKEMANNSLRISISDENTIEDAKYFNKVINNIFELL